MKKLYSYFILLFTAVMLAPTRVYAVDPLEEEWGGKIPPEHQYQPPSNPVDGYPSGGGSPVADGGKTALDYNLFKDIFKKGSNVSFDDALKISGRALYNLIFLISACLIGYRLMKAIYMYFKQDVTRLNKKQMVNEILEPFMGMLGLIAGWEIIRLFVLSVWGFDLGAL